MPKRRIEDEIERLGQSPSPAALKKALSDRVGLLVAKAAKLVAEQQLRELIPDLVAAFDRLLENPVERDPQCWGKNAIAKALTALDYRDSALYLRGSRHVQMEPVWGGQEDTAPALRGACILGLVTCSDIRREVVLRRLVDAVMDPAQTVRVEAARALAEMGGDESPLLLRLKARAVDPEPVVVGQVFDGLLRLEGPAAVEFIAGFFQGQPIEVSAEAALALGTSRFPEAVEALELAFHDTRDPDLRDAIARAISTARHERGFTFLLDLVRNGRAADANIALDALELHRETPEIWRQVEDAVAEAGTTIQQRFRNRIATGG